MHGYVDLVDKRVDAVALSDSPTAVLQVSGMGCVNCAARVRNGLLALPGVLAADVNLDTALVEVRFDPERTGAGELVEAVANAGLASRHDYHARLVDTIW